MNTADLTHRIQRVLQQNMGRPHTKVAEALAALKGDQS